MVAHQIPVVEPRGSPRAGEEATPRSPVHPSKRLLSTYIEKGEALTAGVEEERERGVNGEESEEGGDDEQVAAEPNTNRLFSRRVEALDSTCDTDEEEGRLVMADIGEECGEDEQEEADDPFLGTDGDESQDGKMECNPGWRKKSKRKMEYGKKWIVRNLAFEKDGGSMVPLSVIARKYVDDCLREHQDPLLLSVLARLLHQQFPKAGKCRLGSRKNQKIHYSKLKWLVDNAAQQCNSATAPLTPSVDEKAEKTPFEGSLSPQMQGDVKEPQPIMSGGRGVEKRQHMTSEAVTASPSQSPVGDIDEGEKECPEAAGRLEQVVKKMCSQGKRDLLLKSYAHSASCRTATCSSLCLMFRRVRTHVVTARHVCKVMRIYTVLLKSHVSLCVDNDCGLTACPTLRLSRQNKRCLDGEQKEQQQEKLCVKLSPDLMPSSPPSKLSPDFMPNSPPSIHKDTQKYTPPLQTITVEVDPLWKQEFSMIKRIRA